MFIGTMFGVRFSGRNAMRAPGPIRQVSEVVLGHFLSAGRLRTRQALRLERLRLAIASVHLAFFEIASARFRPVIKYATGDNLVPIVIILIR